MEFDDVQRIWDTQNSMPLYAINEEALHRRILAKKKKARHITNISELLLIIVNLGAGILILGINFSEPTGNIFMYLMAAWMFGTSLYLTVSRIRRISGDGRFDRSMHGDLRHAISVATYQIRLSQLMRWNTLPIATLCLLGLWQSGKPIWVVGLIVLFFALSYYVGGWEHNIYKARKGELEIIQKKLESEDLTDNRSM